MNGGKQEFIRAVRGPLMLIALGSLFALDYYANYPFTRTWPFLLIVFGILKLLERAAGRSSPAPPTDYEGGSPFLGGSA